MQFDWCDTPDEINSARSRSRIKLAHQSAIIGVISKEGIHSAMLLSNRSRLGHYFTDTKKKRRVQFKTLIEMELIDGRSFLSFFFTKLYFIALVRVADRMSKIRLHNIFSKNYYTSFTCDWIELESDRQAHTHRQIFYFIEMCIMLHPYFNCASNLLLAD